MPEREAQGRQNESDRNHAFYLAASRIGGTTWNVIGQVWYQVLKAKLSARASFIDMARTQSPSNRSSSPSTHSTSRPSPGRRRPATDHPRAAGAGLLPRGAADLATLAVVPLIAPQFRDGLRLFLATLDQFADSATGDFQGRQGPVRRKP